MFKENIQNNQIDFYGIENILKQEKLLQLKESEEYFFYQIIFKNINEKSFSELYSNKKSRPNAAINCLVAALILLTRKGWTYEELFEHIDFDLKTRYALGLTDLNETPFCRATIFNFQNRLSKYYFDNKIDLLEKVFEELTEEQIKALKIKTDIQRSDSTLASSNIRNYSRLQLIIEILLRLYRILSDEDKLIFNNELSEYTKQSSENYIYKFKRDDIPHKLEQLGEIYYKLYNNLKDKYHFEEIFKIFERVYFEQFHVIEEKVTVKSNEELNSSMLQSPDDADATYRKKKDKESKGFIIHASETCNPENQFQLVTDVVVEKNNVDDSKILSDRLDKMKEKTPDLNEEHTDGGYGSIENDQKMEELGILHVQTAVRGRKAKVEMTITKNNSVYEVSCPIQRAEVVKTKKRFKAIFDLNKCNECPFHEDCPGIKSKDKMVLYFTSEDYLKNKRQRNILNIPKTKRKLRPNIEATMKEYHGSMINNKLKTRGLIKAGFYAITMSISINFGRIYRYCVSNPNEKTRITIKILYFYFIFSLISNKFIKKVRFV